MSFRRVPLLILALVLPSAPVVAQQEIKTPFGMQLGEPQGRIRDVVGKAKAKVVEERSAGPREILVV